MKQPQEPIEAIRDIRNFMERSSRFVALSGRAGIIAGLITLIGIGAAYYLLDATLEDISNYQFLFQADGTFDTKHVQLILLILSGIFFLSVTTACILAAQNAKKKSIAAWDATSKRVVFHFAVPLFTGALFAMALLHQHNIALIAPSTLIFYGLAHVNISKYTIDEIRYFGIVQILLGLIGSMHTNMGLLLWVLGFGLIHIIYGAIIYIKYEK